MGVDDDFGGEGLNGRENVAPQVNLMDWKGEGC